MSVGGPEFRQFKAKIMCSKCGAFGEMVWENQSGNRSLVSVSSGFHERISKKKPYPIELVCHGCGSAQPEEEA